MENDKNPVGRFDKTNKTNTVDREKIEKVIAGSAKVRNNGVRKLTNTFFAEDMNTVTSNLRDEVFIPGLKKLIVNLLKDGVDILFNGSVSRGKNSDRFVGDRVSYDRFSSNRPPEPIRTSTRFTYDEFEFESRGQAESVLDAMHGVIRRYGWVTVSELYEMVGRTGPFTGNNYGWTDISNAYVDRVYGGGYVIKMPKAIPIER